MFNRQSNQSSNLNSIGNRKSTIAEVDDLAEELMCAHNNYAYRGWYLKTIYLLGIDQVRILDDRTKDSTLRGKKFAQLANEQRRMLEAKTRLGNIAERIGNG